LIVENGVLTPMSSALHCTFLRPWLANARALFIESHHCRRSGSMRVKMSDTVRENEPFSMSVDDTVRVPRMDLALTLPLLVLG